MRPTPCPPPPLQGVAHLSTPARRCDRRRNPRNNRRPPLSGRGEPITSAFRASDQAFPRAGTIHRRAFLIFLPAYLLTRLPTYNLPPPLSTPFFPKNLLY